MPFHVRVVEAADESLWSTLYAGYRAFYELPDDSDAVRTTWMWVVGGAHGLRGLVAVDDDGGLVGLANIRSFARPSRAALALYLDDLFTSPSARGKGVATALLREAAAIADREGANVVRWITAADNETARHLYDKLAVATPWVTYDMQPATA